MRERVRDIFRDILGDQSLILTDESSPNTVDGWDSLNHIMIVATIEDDFDVEFSMAEIGSFKTFGDILKSLEEKK